MNQATYFGEQLIRSITLLVLLLLVTINPLDAQKSDQALSTESILKSFAEDYMKDTHFTEDWTFGVKVDKEKWTIQAIVETAETKAAVKVLPGFPEIPTFYFKTTKWALEDIYAGKMNALTGAVKAFSTDYAPFDLDVMEGFQPDESFVSKTLPLLFHFWTKGTPEIIPFGQQYTRNTHGAQASIFYYQPGIRSGWGILHPGQHANEHPSSQTNEFPSLIILTKGTVTAKLNGVDHTVKSGNAIFIPPGMKHEFINPFDEPAEFILLMFGEGA